MTEPAQSPPQDEPAVAQIASVLATYASADLIARALSSLLGLPSATLHAADNLASRGTRHIPRTVGTGPNARAAAKEDVYYRAAYIWQAAKRMESTRKMGVDLVSAVKSESPFYRMHEVARRNRIVSAAQVDQAAEGYGVREDAYALRRGRLVALPSSLPGVNGGGTAAWLGWYLGNAKEHTPECVAAAGHNFLSTQKPVIGWPGAVHVHCQCVPGMPFLGAGTVDDAVSRLRGRKAA